MEQPDLLAKLQSRRGYRGQRISPLRSNSWVAEVYGPLDRGNRKGWRVLRDGSKRNDPRIFPTPEQAHHALVVYQQEREALERQFE